MTLTKAENEAVLRALALKKMLKGMQDEMDLVEKKLVTLLRKTPNECLRVLNDGKLVTIRMNTGDRVQLHMEDSPVVTL